MALIWRQAKVDIEIGGYAMPQGSGIIVAPYLTHRHPEFWSDPEVFDPERFNTETAPKRHHYAYFPFGSGRHICLGKHFALLEAQVVLATVLQQSSLRLLTPDVPTPRLLLTLRPKDGLSGFLAPHSGQAKL